MKKLIPSLLLSALLAYPVHAQVERGNGGDVSEIEVKLSVLDIGHFLEKYDHIRPLNQVAGQFSDAILAHESDLKITLVNSRAELGADRTCISNLNEWKIKCVRGELAEARHKDLGLYYAILGHEVGRILNLENTDLDEDTISTYPYSPALAYYGPEIRSMRSTLDESYSDAPKSLIESGFVCSDDLASIADGRGSMLGLKKSKILLSHPGGSFTYFDYSKPNFANNYNLLEDHSPKNSEDARDVQKSARSARSEMRREMLGMNAGLVAKATVIGQGRWETELKYYYKSAGNFDQASRSSMKEAKFLTAFDLNTVIPDEVLKIGSSEDFINHMSKLTFKISYVPNMEKHLKGTALECSFSPDLYEQVLWMTSGQFSKRRDLNGTVSFDLPRRFGWGGFKPRWLKTTGDRRSYSIQKNLPEVPSRSEIQKELDGADRSNEKPTRADCTFVINDHIGGWLSGGNSVSEEQWNVIRKIMNEEKGYTKELKMSDFKDSWDLRNTDDGKGGFYGGSKDFAALEFFVCMGCGSGGKGHDSVQMGIERAHSNMARFLTFNTRKSDGYRTFSDAITTGVADKVRRLVPACGSEADLF